MYTRLPNEPILLTLGPFILGVLIPLGAFIMYAYIPKSFKSRLGHGTTMVRGAIGSISWGPATSFAKQQVNGMFERLDTGTLTVIDHVTGEKRTYGQPMMESNDPAEGDAKIRAGPKANLVVYKETFWVRVMLFADMGFAESFMLGEVGTDDLAGFFQLFIANRKALGEGNTTTSILASMLTNAARATNTLSNSLLNVSAHYDISNEMFAAFLSHDMTYSCPIWKLHGSSDKTEETLEEAQMTKLHRFIEGTKIKSTDHVLEIGTGWGSFAIEAVRTTGCRVTSLTLSIEQKMLAEKRIKNAGYQDKIKVLLMDYRNLKVPSPPYDKIVSIEMLEAVGAEYLQTYFSCVNRLLKPVGGIAAFQCITMPESRYAAYAKGEDFIRKYIFPGGHLPSISQLVGSIDKGSDGTLIVERVENIGGHYARTLRLWKEDFLRNFESKIRPALKSEHRGMTNGEIDVFRRKWEYYFAYCEAGFATKTLGDVIITVGREGSTELMEGVPL